MRSGRSPAWLPFVCLVLGAGQALGQSVVFGDPPDSGTGNCFPFNCAITHLGFPATRYQQVYNSAEFPARVCITGISFFDEERPNAVFEEADYSFTLSTSNFPVNSLDTIDLDRNPGADAQLFAAQRLTGPTGARFTILAGAGGGTEFDYDPGLGDLLMDVARTNPVLSSGEGALDSRNGTAAGQFSRAHDFGRGFPDRGLKTEFSIQVGGCNTPTVARCVESVNPPGTNTPPAGSTTLPGSKGGENEDGFYELVSEDNEDGTAPVFVTNASGSATFGPFSSGSVVKITEAPGRTPTAKSIGGPGSAVAAHITLDSDAFAFAVDSFGEESPVVSCLVPPLPK